MAEEKSGSGQQSAPRSVSWHAHVGRALRAGSRRSSARCGDLEADVPRSEEAAMPSSSSSEPLFAAGSARRFGAGVQLPGRSPQPPRARRLLRGAVCSDQGRGAAPRPPCAAPGPDQRLDRLVVLEASSAARVAGGERLANAADPVLAGRERHGRSRRKDQGAGSPGPDDSICQAGVAFM